MNSLRTRTVSSFAGFRFGSKIARGHGPTHGPDGYLLGQGRGKTMPFSTGDEPGAKRRLKTAMIAYVAIGTVAPVLCVWFAQSKVADK